MDNQTGEISHVFKAEGAPKEIQFTEFEENPQEPIYDTLIKLAKEKNTNKTFDQADYVFLSAGHVSDIMDDILDVNPNADYVYIPKGRPKGLETYYCLIPQNVLLIIMKHSKNNNMLVNNIFQEAINQYNIYTSDQQVIKYKESKGLSSDVYRERMTTDERLLKAQVSSTLRFFQNANIDTVKTPFAEQWGKITSAIGVTPTKQLEQVSV